MCMWYFWQRGNNVSILGEFDSESRARRFFAKKRDLLCDV